MKFENMLNDLTKAKDEKRKINISFKNEDKKIIKENMPVYDIKVLDSYACREDKTTYKMVKFLVDNDLAMTEKFSQGVPGGGKTFYSISERNVISIRKESKYIVETDDNATYTIEICE